MKKCSIIFWPFVQNVQNVIRLQHVNHHKFEKKSNNDINILNNMVVYPTLFKITLWLINERIAYNLILACQEQPNSR